jgi:hypothetical protein
VEGPCKASTSPACSSCNALMMPKRISFAGPLCISAGLYTALSAVGDKFTGLVFRSAKRFFLAALLFAYLIKRSVYKIVVVSKRTIFCG